MSNQNQKVMLSQDESNLLVQAYLKEFHPEAIEGMNKTIVIAGWVKQLMEKDNKTIDPKLVEVPQMSIENDDIDTYPVNSILKPAIEGNIKAITNYLSKEPSEYELKEFLIAQSKLLIDQVIYEYQQQILNK